MTAPQMSRCDQGHKGGTTANHAMSGGVNTRSGLYNDQGESPGGVLSQNLYDLILLVSVPDPRV